MDFFSFFSSYYMYTLIKTFLKISSDRMLIRGEGGTLNQFSYSLAKKKYDVGTQKNRLYETVLLSTHNIC